jgi:hypothetical protein
MPRYFFHVHADADVRDDHGMELQDDATARLHGVAMLGKVLREDPNVLLMAGELRVTATREDGVVIFTIETTLERA